jgi:GntR family transcriptional regulator
MKCEAVGDAGFVPHLTLHEAETWVLANCRELKKNVLNIDKRAIVAFAGRQRSRPTRCTPSEELVNAAYRFLSVDEWMIIVLLVGGLVDLAVIAAVPLLQAGQRLPPVRQVAADLGLAGGTVARAYRELAQAGLVEGGGRHGTLIRSGTRTLADDQSGQRALSAAADHLASIARDLGLSDDAVLAVVRNALARMAPQRA